MLSIISPVYNERGNITQLLDQLREKVKITFELLIVYDFEEDSTCPVVKKYIAENHTKNISLVRNNVGSGRGVINAIKTGIARVTGEATLVLMADLSDDISQIDYMYRLIQDGADIICASRYMKGGKKIGGPRLKTLMSRAAGLSLHYLFGVPTVDATNAFKMYRTKILHKIQIESTGGFEYSLEIVLKAFKKGYKIVEIPTVWRDRAAGKSNFKLMKWLPKYINTYMRIFKS
jgi:glycosyltransferase involved in cell wall biosynthesis